MSTIKDEAIKLRQNIDNVYEAGQNSMVDENKIIEKTATGRGLVILNDVSEIPHDISVQLSSDTVTDFSSEKLKVCGKNLFDFSKLESTSDFTVNEDKTITINANCYQCYTGFTLSELCPMLEVGDVICITINTTGNNLIFCKSGVSLYSGTLYTVTEDMLNSEIAIYGLHPTHEKYGELSILYSIQIEYSSKFTGYEEFKYYAEYPVSIDGTVDGIKHISNNMILKVDTKDIGVSVSYRKSWGIQAEYDKFWDNYQNYGERKNYSYAFAGLGWDDETFKPKYDIKPTEPIYMFISTNITDLVEDLNKCGVTLDTSSCWTLMYLFQNSTITHLPVIDASYAQRMGYFCYNAKQLETIDKLIVSETTDSQQKQMGSNSFQSASKLTNITMEGTLAFSINFSWSPLSVDSMKSVISCLKNYAGTEYELTYKVSFTSDCWAALEASGAAPDGGTWEEYVQSLGWNV